MPYTLNPALRFLRDPQGKGVRVLSRDGAVARINEDAFSLLERGDSTWIREPAYRAFAEQALLREWILPIRSEPGRHPLSRIQLELLTRCNLRCLHCYCEGAPDGDPGLSTTDILRLLDEAAQLGVTFLDVTGGEPLLRPDLFEILHRARDRGLFLSLFTNATLVSERLARALKEAGVRTVRSSIDALNPEAHDRLRGAKGAFSDAIRGIRLLRAEGLTVSVTIMVGRHNHGELAKLVRFLREELDVTIRLDRIIPAGRGTDAEAARASLGPREYAALLRKAFPNGDVAPGKVCDSAFVDTPYLKPWCGVGNDYLFVRATGDVVLCPTLSEREDPAFLAGNIMTRSLREIWDESATFAKFRGIQCRAIKDCPSAAKCRGGCRSNAYLMGGRVDSPDSLQCLL